MVPTPTVTVLRFCKLHQLTFRITMAKYQVFLTLLALAAAMAAPTAETNQAEDQNAADFGNVRYAPYHYGYYGGAVVAPLAYSAAVQPVVPAPYITSPVQRIAALPSVKYVADPVAYHYAPAAYSYGQEQVHPTGYSYSHVSRNW